jgi:hypothetical protein
MVTPSRDKNSRRDGRPDMLTPSSLLAGCGNPFGASTGKTHKSTGTLAKHIGVTYGPRSHGDGGNRARGLESGTLTMFNSLSRIGVVVVLSLMALAVVWSGWRAGEVPSPEPVGTPARHAA